MRKKSLQKSSRRLLKNEEITKTMNILKKVVDSGTEVKTPTKTKTKYNVEIKITVPPYHLISVLYI